MILSFIVAVLCIGAMMLVFLARTIWGSKDDLFYLSGKQTREVIKDQLPPPTEIQGEIPEISDPTVQYMLSLLSRSDEENYTK